MSFVDNLSSIGFDGLFYTTSNGTVLPRRPEDLSKIDLDKKAHLLLQRLDELHYSPKTIKGDVWMYHLISREFCGNKLDFYNTLLKRYSGHRQQQCIVRRWMMFDLCDILPERKQTKAQRISGYYNQLNHSFHALLDLFVLKSNESGHRASTTNTEAASLSRFLLFLQQEGLNDIEHLTESLVQKYKILTGVTNDVITRLGRMLQLCDIDKAGCFPSRVSSVKHVYRSLSDDEFNLFKYCLADKTNGLSLLERAVGATIGYTALRASDVKNLKFSNINWATETISLIQIKTGEPVELPLIPCVGNAIYDYLVSERPQSNSEYIFLAANSKKGEYAQISPYVILNRIYDIAGIRNNGKRGSHILRHSAASEMLDEGTDIGIISSTLGHSNVQSTLKYISISHKLLKECALSISHIPVISNLYK